MTNVKDLDLAGAYADMIVDEKRAVQQFANLGAPSNQAAHARKARQQFDMLNQGVSEVEGSSCVISSKMVNDGGEIT